MVRTILSAQIYMHTNVKSFKSLLPIFNSIGMIQPIARDVIPSGLTSSLYFLLSLPWDDHASVFIQDQATSLLVGA